MSKNLGTALITGASGGIGAVYADRLARRGYNLILVARDNARLETLANDLKEQTGVSVEVMVADLTSDDDVTRVEQRLEEQPISLLVNNAGMSLKGGVLENGGLEFNRIIALNVTTPTRLAAAAAKSFVRAGKGAIINISSVLALAPERFDGVYSGTKSYLLNLSQAMAAQLSDKGVYTQVVLPGATRTELWERSGKDINSFPPEIVMSVDNLVDAALVGFDRGETVTIPPLEDENEWEVFQSARLVMAPRLSRRDVAARYETGQAEA